MCAGSAGKRRWDAVKIKALTGGDPIAARFMRADFFTYTPEFKLLLAGNHKPGLSAVDEAWRRRFNLIPFAVTIPKDRARPGFDREAETRVARYLAMGNRGLSAVGRARA